jgi:hypothetical protein
MWNVHPATTASSQVVKQAKGGEGGFKRLYLLSLLGKTDKSRKNEVWRQYQDSAMWLLATSESVLCPVSPFKLPVCVCTSFGHPLQQQQPMVALARVLLYICVWC